jgi:hypothetical protein
MKLFLHTPTRIRIINDDEQEFTCSPAAFAGLEPEYPGLPEGCNYRYWTPDYSYLEGEGITTPDPVNCGIYIDKVSEYTQNIPVIYMHITLSQTTLCVNLNPPETIHVHGVFKPSADPTSPTLNIDHEWLIRLRHEANLVFDSFRVEFTGGECDVDYGYREGLPLGIWTLQAADFDLVREGAQWYEVRLAAPVVFTAYREL